MMEITKIGNCQNRKVFPKKEIFSKKPAVSPLPFPFPSVSYR
jgi:hypothetical protein